MAEGFGDDYCNEHCNNKCTNHIYDEVTHAWIRCPRANHAVFHGCKNEIPPKYSGLRIADLKSTDVRTIKAISVAQTLVNRITEEKFPKKHVIFTGDDFSMKLDIGCVTLQEMMLAGKSIRFLSVSALTEMYFSERSRFLETFNSDVMLIELGYEMANGSTGPIIQEVFRERTFMRSNYTFFLSRFSVAEFNAKYPPEVASFFSTQAFSEYKVGK